MEYGKIRADMQTANLQQVKQNNLTLIFNLIYKCRPVSRAELAKETKLSPTTVSTLVDDLISRGIVCEIGVGETGTSGRKPILIDINPNGGFIVSIELVTECITCFVYDLLCSQVDERKHSIPDFSNTGKELVSMMEGILKENGIAESKLLGISIGVPGLIDYKTNCVISSTVIPIDGNNNFYAQLRDRYPAIPIILENESCFCAYAEKEFDCDIGSDNLVFIDVNVGIGAGVLIGGKVYRGSFGIAGEIGHVSIDINGPKCKCGSRGCLEMMANIPSMIQSIIFSIMSGRDTVVTEMTNNNFNLINIDLIRIALDKKDEVVTDIVKTAAIRMAFGINNIMNILNPSVVIIGGEITKLGAIYLEILKENLVCIGFKQNISNIEVRYSTLKENACVLGGARFLLDSIFELPDFSC